MCSCAFLITCYIFYKRYSNHIIFTDEMTPECVHVFESTPECVHVLVILPAIYST
jgi:hypothetical protein